MGLFDKIKKAIDDSGVVDAAKVAVKSFTESTESKTVETPQKQIVEEKVAEKEVKETKPKAPPKPACEYGKCAVLAPNGFTDYLYFSCDESVQCKKKDKYADTLGGIEKLYDENMLPVIRSYTNDSLSFSYNNEHKAAKKLISTYVPTLKQPGEDFLFYIEATFKTSGFGVQNPLVTYFINLNRRNYTLLTDKKSCYIAVAKIVGGYAKNIDISAAEWLYNPSLYESDDLDYVTKQFINYSDASWTSAHLLDAGVVDLRQFYDENGTIKSSTDICNIVTGWRHENVNEEFERRLKICDACQKRLECKSKGLHPNCPSFLPFGV